MELNGNEKNPLLNIVLLFHAYMHGMYVDCSNFKLLSIWIRGCICLHVWYVAMDAWVKVWKWMKYEWHFTLYETYKLNWVKYRYLEQFGWFQLRILSIKLKRSLINAKIRYAYAKIQNRRYELWFLGLFWIFRPVEPMYIYLLILRYRRSPSVQRRLCQNFSKI